MKTSLKSIGFLSLVICTNAFALSKEPSLCEGSSALCALYSPGGLYGSITGYYVKPNETGLGMFSDSWQYATANGIEALSKPIKSNFEWAGGFTVGYDLRDTANNIEFAFLYLHNDKHAINDTSDGPISFGSVFFPDVTVPLPPGAVLVSDAHLAYTVSQYDLTIGRRYADFQGHFMIHPKIGVRYAQLEHSLTFAAPGDVISNFNGAGPLIGIDGRYAFTPNFGILANIDYAPLVGTINSHSFLNFPVLVSYVSPDQQRVVGNMNAKIGVDYVHIFQNGATAALEVGYQVNNYFNTFDIIQGNYAANQKIAEITTNTFSFAGPYITLSAHA